MVASTMAAISESISIPVKLIICDAYVMMAKHDVNMPKLFNVIAIRIPFNASLLTNQGKIRWSGHYRME